MDTLDYDTPLTTVMLVIAGLVAVALLYRFFYRQRDTGGTDQRNWVNDSNYNIAASESEAEALAGATPKEARHMVEVDKAEGPYPPSEGEFEQLERKLSDEPHDTESVRERLRKPS